MFCRHTKLLALGAAVCAVTLWGSAFVGIRYLIPVVAIVLGWAALGEAPALVAAAGGALCFAGVALARRS